MKQLVANVIEAETGGTNEEWEACSVLHFASRIKAKALLLNGAKDDRTAPSQARRLAEEISRNGGDANAIISPDHGHQIPADIRDKDVDPLIVKVLIPSIY